jgi:3-oxoacyl-[acyl-carrier protein] reductase
VIDFSGKVVLVTGGGAGIGRATVQAFADLGASVVALEVDPARAEDLRSQLDDRAFVVTGDATVATDVSALADAIGDRYGRLDVLVNNVGHFMTRPTPFERLTDEQIDDVYRVNLKHIFLITRAVLPLLRASAGAEGSPSITNVSSIEGFRGIPRFAVYGAFKAAVTGFTMSLALELGPEGIRVNAVAPETTDSAQVPLDRMIHESQRHHIPRWIPLGRFGTPQDIAGCVLFLASPLAAWVSGTVVHADGGALAAAGWYRDDQGTWTNMPVIKGNSGKPAEAAG